MSTDSDHRPSFRFRDKFSRLKEKIKDKAIKHNVTLFVHQNLTTNNNYSDNSHHGFRQHMHHFKDVLKNKTHYESIKDKIKDKIDEKFDIHDNKTYPKGFYDSLFSPETENDVYLQTALICLWIIALLCIIPTIIIIFLPARKKKPTTTTSTNMIFFHIFLCELLYLTYILLAMINVAKDFRLGSVFCDIANYGMYVTIPIMQFTLLFLSLERLSKHFNLTMTWLKIFTKPYLIQVILCVIWIVLIALLFTFMFIKKQFSFNFIKDKVESLAPPIIGDVVSRITSRRHHCSIDGRLSTVFKTLIIILFIILIVKPIFISLGFNLLTPFCCKNKRKDLQKHGDRRTTTLVTIFILLNFFFSFPFYFVSMFNNILTNIDSTKTTFIILLKICFILRITNIIFECLAFYIFERNSWNLLSKLFYYGTCKKFSILNKLSDDDVMYTKDPDVQDLINKTRLPSDDEDDDEQTKKIIKKKQIIKKKIQPLTESDDDDGAFKKITKTIDDEKIAFKRKKQPNKKTIETDEDETKEMTTIKRISPPKKIESDEEDKPKQTTITKRKSREKTPESDDDDDEEKERETIKRKSRPKVEQEEEEVINEKPKSKSTKSRHNDVEIQVPNGRPISHRPSSTTDTHKTTKPVQRHSNTKRRSTEPSPSPDESEADTASNASHTSSKMNKPSVSPQPIRKQTTKTRSSSNEQKRSRTISPNDQHSRHKKESSPSSRPRIKATTSNISHPTTKKHNHGISKKGKTRKKKPKKDYQTRIIEMSDEV